MAKANDENRAAGMPYILDRDLDRVKTETDTDALEPPVPVKNTINEAQNRKASSTNDEALDNCTSPEECGKIRIKAHIKAARESADKHVMKQYEQAQQETKVAVARLRQQASDAEHKGAEWHKKITKIRASRVRKEKMAKVEAKEKDAKEAKKYQAAPWQHMVDPTIPSPIMEPVHKTYEPVLPGSDSKEAIRFRERVHRENARAYRPIETTTTIRSGYMYANTVFGIDDILPDDTEGDSPSDSTP